MQEAKVYRNGEEIGLLQKVIALQTMIACRLEISLVDDVLESLLERLERIF